MNYDALFSSVGQGLQQSAIRQMGTVAAQNPDLISLAPGYPDPATFAWDAYHEITEALLTQRGRATLQYGPTQGHPPLVAACVDLLRERGIAATPQELLITTGSQQGLDLVARVLLDPGDVVLVELPSYTGAIAAFKNVQASLVGIPQQADGIDLEALDGTYRRLAHDGRRVKFLYLVPNFQNPTGLLVSLAKRRALLEWASRRDVLLVEDDPYGALYFEDTTTAAETRPIKADDTGQRVIYLTSFSKTLSPAFRTAIMVAPPALADRFEIGKQAADLCTSNFDQAIVLEAINRGVLARQLPLLRQHYQRNRTVMESALRASLGEAATWVTPRGGFFLWVSLPDAVDTHRMIARAVAQGVIYVAGGAFFVDGTGANTLRLSFSLATPEKIVEGVTRVAAAVKEELAALGAAALVGR